MSEEFTCPCGTNAEEFTPVTTTITTPNKKIIMSWLKCSGCKKEYLAKKETIYRLHLVYKEEADHEMVEKGL